MRLAVIADTAHYRGADGTLYALAPVVAQLERIFTVFESISVCAPLHNGEPPASFSPYMTSIDFEPVSPGGGSSLADKCLLLIRSIEWWKAARRTAKRADALHFRCPSNVAAVGILATWLMRRRRYAMYAGSWRGYEGEPYTYRAQRWLLSRRFFDGVVTVYGRRSSDPSHVIDFYSPSFERSEWIENTDFVEAKVRRLRSIECVDPVRLVSVGALTPDKGHHIVISAVAQLQRSGMNTMLAIVGGGPEHDRLKRQVDDEGARQVSFFGFSSQADVRQAFRHADLAVLASRSEGYPKVALEAMSLGTPPLLTRFALAPSLVANGRGALVDRTPASVAAVVRELASDPARIAVMIESGRAFTKLRTLDGFQRDIQTILSEHWGDSSLESPM